MIRIAVDMRRIRKQIGSWLEDEFGAEVAVRNADEDYGSPTMPFLTFAFVLPPGATHIDGQAIHTLPTSMKVVFANPTAGKDYRLLINRYPVDHIAVDADADRVRDAFVTAINATSFPESVTASALTVAGGMQIDQVELGDLREVKAIPTEGAFGYGDEYGDAYGGALDVEVVTLATATAAETVGARTGLLSVNAYSHSPVRHQPSAEAIIATVQSAVFERETITRLQRHGVSLGKPTAPRDLSALSGSEIEQRVQIDIPVFVRSRLTRAVDTIETVEITQQAPYEHTFQVAAP